MNTKKTITADGFLRNSQPNALIAAPLWTLIFFSQLVVSCLVAWHLLAQVNFVYPAAYEALAIDEHIARFAPANRFRPDFETTDKPQHLALFAEIGNAVQNHGEGLEKITYQTASGQTIALLRKAEVIHLQDVANLVDFFYLSGGVCTLLLLISLAGAYSLKLTFPGPGAVAMGILAVVAAITLPLLIIGPKKVFYWLHIQIFPPDHEWFFYYQESLMTTLMKAPDVFGFIGGVMGLIALVLWILQILAVRWYFAKRPGTK
ncbi:MAG: DUF1461 domain-containing protein [Ketobacteraceae bacterium]|nr:DUF1461 domain-containing protein [Ketobacteraceae bacterium]